MYERFTDRARKVMQLANQEAQRFNHEYIGTEHVLLGLVKEGSGVAAEVLKNLDVDLRRIRNEVEKIVQSGPDMVTMGKLPQMPRAKKVIEYAMEEARNLNHNYVGTEHLLLGLLREQDAVAAQVLINLGLKLEDVREKITLMLGKNDSKPTISDISEQLRQCASCGVRFEDHIGLVGTCAKLQEKRKMDDYLITKISEVLREISITHEYLVEDLYTLTGLSGEKLPSQRDWEQALKQELSK